MSDRMKQHIHFLLTKFAIKQYESGKKKWSTDEF